MGEMTLTIPRPNARQTLFFTDRHRYVAFGGARGGGKSWAVRVKAIGMAFEYPGIRMVIVRRSYPELRQNHIEPLLSMLSPGLYDYNDSRKEMLFPTGSKLSFRFLANDADVLTFQGAEYDVIFLDEATQLTESQFQALTACLRGANSLPKRFYLTCNPGGVGHAWVKRLFIDRHYKEGERGEDYSFIRSRLTDNTALMRSDPDYLHRLEALPPKLRRAWLEGDWNIFEGQFFEEFTDDPAHYADRRFTHVIDPFPPPLSWPLFRSFDFGYAKPFSAAWWAADEEGTLYRILELYGWNGSANEGARWEPERIFSEIASIEREHEWLRGRTITGVADPSIWDASRGESVAETAARHGVYYSPGDNHRVAGWMQLHNRLKFDSEGCPSLYVFSCCKAARRTLPLLEYDPHKPEDLNSEGEDHAADEMRYFVMSRPAPAPHIPAPDPYVTDPRKEILEIPKEALLRRGRERIVVKK
ncbi:MAG: phage terminase large subunit [Clostridia bacterium]|nr:phage terminase large subunit [Clostridia bacterium]